MGNPVTFIRKEVLGLTQAEMAQVFRVTQPTVHRWERDGLFPSEHLRAVRDMARQSRPDWRDEWFFDPPAEPSRAA